jgi:hypothetical protein
METDAVSPGNSIWAQPQRVGILKQIALRGAVIAPQSIKINFPEGNECYGNRRKTMVEEGVRPGALAAMFAFALAMPVVGMVIAGLMMGRPGFALLGLGLFAGVLGLYFAAADLVFGLDAETGDE